MKTKEDRQEREGIWTEKAFGQRKREGIKTTEEREREGIWIEKERGHKDNREQRKRERGQEDNGEEQQKVGINTIEKGREREGTKTTKH